MIKYRILHIPTGEWVHKRIHDVYTSRETREVLTFSTKVGARFFILWKFRYSKLYFSNDSFPALVEFNKAEFEIIPCEMSLAIPIESQSGQVRKGVTKYA